jgi:hypothetical protein
VPASDLSTAIERAPCHIDPDAFKALYRLTREHEWLEEPGRQTALAELWNLCDAQRQRELVQALIKRFHYIKQLRDPCGRLVDYMLSEWKVNPEQTVIAGVESEVEADGSQVVLQAIKNFLDEDDGWSGKRLVPNWMDGLHFLSDGWSLVLVEDFLGSGTKIRKRMRLVEQELQRLGKKEVRTFLLVVAGMKAGQSAVEELGIAYHCDAWLKRGISDYEEATHADELIGEMKRLEDKLSKRTKGKKLPSLGYKESEALVFLDPIGVPNNVFPIFWWPNLADGQPRRTFFRRFG